MTAPKRITASQIDLVDARGTIRASLTTGDDMDGRRIAPFAGLVIRDSSGKERGGIGVVDVQGENRIVTALDHPGGDAVGSMVTDTGEVFWMMRDAPTGDGVPRATRVTISVAPDGTPSMCFLDAEERPRLRFTLTSSGAGAIEFLNADGGIADRIVPEDDA